MRPSAALALVMLSAAPLAAQQPPTRPPEIAVSAHGEARVAPDRASVTLGVQSRAASASDAARENAALQRAVIDTLHSIGFDAAQITTANYNVRADYRPTAPGEPPSVTGYVVSNTVRVMLRDPDHVSRVIDAALGKGANAVHGLQFYLADPAPARQAALLDAVAKGRADAEALARAAGGRLGAVIEISTAPASDIRIYQRAAAGGSATPIEPGQTSVTATVVMRFALVPVR